MFEHICAHMKTINALKVRKSFGAVLNAMERDKKPVIVTRDQKPVAALVPLSIFRQRFVDYLTEEAVAQAIEQLHEVQSVVSGPDSLVELRKLRARA